VVFDAGKLIHLMNLVKSKQTAMIKKFKQGIGIAEKS